MLCVCLLLQPTNWNLTAKYLSAAKPATKVLSKLVAASISVRCSWPIFCSSSTICFSNSLNFVNPQYMCCEWQQLTPLKMLEMWRLITGINLVNFCDMIYVPKNLQKSVLKWYHSYLQHQGGDRLAQTLTTIFRWSGIFDQAWNLCRTCKYCQKFKKCDTKYELLPAKDA